MAATAQPVMMTVEQYRQLPDDNPAVSLELHLGQVVEVTRPKMKHARIQSQLVRLLRPLAEHLGRVESEMAFRVIREYDLRAADVGFVTRERWKATDDNDNLLGSPELVVEVLSPSNRTKEMLEKAALYLGTGAQEFWVIDPDKKTVVVTNQAGSVVYDVTQTMPLPMFGAELAVSQIFTEHDN